MDTKKITVEIAYALPHEQLIISMMVAEGTTVKQAIEDSEILLKFPEIDLKVNKLGIFGKTCNFDTKLRDHDRIEIYRKLIADPKVIRKQRQKAES